VLNPATASLSDPQDAAPAPEAARPSPAANLEIVEDKYEPCRCGEVIRGDSREHREHATYRPSPNCFWCQGTGYRIAHRVLRPSPKPDFSEQTALAQIRTLEALVLKAATTLDQCADLLMQAGKVKDAQHTKAAAKAVRKSVGEQA
jgi:hypothetical protein